MPGSTQILHNKALVSVCFGKNWSQNCLKTNSRQTPFGDSSGKESQWDVSFWYSIKLGGDSLHWSQKWVCQNLCFSADEAICHHTKVLRLSICLHVPNSHIFAPHALSLCFQKSDLRKQITGTIFRARWRSSVHTQVASQTHRRTLHTLTSSQGSGSCDTAGAQAREGCHLCRNVSSWVNFLSQALFWL